MQEGEEGTSSAIAFALAGVLFIAAISTVLVYTNDRIPPPSKSQPHEESTAEARQLMDVFVLGGGTDGWSGTAWNESVDDNPSDPDPDVPGLRYCPNNRCSGAKQLDKARLVKLRGASESSSTGTYHYEELRSLLGFTENGRGFHLVVTYAANGTVLLDYGNAPPERVANRPATGYLTLDDGAAVRAVVQVFLDS